LLKGKAAIRSKRGKKKRQFNFGGKKKGIKCQVEDTKNKILWEKQEGESHARTSYNRDRKREGILGGGGVKLGKRDRISNIDRGRSRRSDYTGEVGETRGYAKSSRGGRKRGGKGYQEGKTV